MLRRIINSGLVYLASSVMLQISNVISVVLIMNSYELSDFGMYGYVVGFFNLFAFVLDGGIKQYIIMKFNKRGGGPEKIFIN